MMVPHALVMFVCGRGNTAGECGAGTASPLLVVSVCVWAVWRENVPAACNALCEISARSSPNSELWAETVPKILRLPFGWDSNLRPPGF